MNKKQITNELIRELDILKTIDKPWAKDFIQGYHDGLIFAIDRLIDGSRLFIDIGDKRELIGFNPKKRYFKTVLTDKVKAGDYRFGCCDDVVIRDDKILLCTEYGNDPTYFYAKKGDQIIYKTYIKVNWINNWKTIIRKYLKINDAQFVFSRIKYERS